LSQPLRSCFSRTYAWHIHEDLAVEKMNEAASHLLGSHDFAAFGSPTDGTDSTVREIFAARWERDRNDPRYLQFIVRGSGFLRSMVRSLVGTLVMVGREKISEQDLKAILMSRDRSNAGRTAPAHGLFLDRVLYSEDPKSDQDVTSCRQFPLTRPGLFV
jgi:tRNA pseudouridine38-40 synthase